MSNYGAIGWQPEQPCVISRGEFKLYDDDAIYLGQPVTVDVAHGTSGVDTEDGNKVWVEPYDDANSIEKCVGVSITNKLAKGNANEERAGLGGYRRDLRLIQFGLVPMLSAEGSATLNFGDELAPKAGGFIKWLPGMAKLGKLWQQECPSGMFGLVFIDLEHENLTYIEEVDVTVTTHVATLSYVPAIMNYTEGTTATAAGPKTFGFSNSTPAAGDSYVDKAGKEVTFNSTDAVTVADIGYWYIQ